MAMNVQLVESESSAKIKVLGIGGGGGNAVNDMIRAELAGVDFITANTDVQALGKNLAPIKIKLGQELTRGLGAGGNPEIGRNATLADADRLREILKGADMVFITAGLGGGTGTGGAGCARPMPGSKS
jgi:cell division protein FtsZ